MQTALHATLAPTTQAPQAIARDSPPFVGRDRVLERLERALEAAERGRGRVCVLMGEAGIGKTRALETFTERLASPVRCAWGFCKEVGNTPPLWPWLRLLREMASLPQPASEREALLAALRELEGLLEPARVASQVGRNTAFEGAPRHRSFDVFARTFVRAAKHAPVVLVLDDVHRADAASLELLGVMTDAIAHARILVVATLRHTAGNRAPRPDTRLPYVLGHVLCDRITLERLREEDVAAYVAALVDDVDGSQGRAVFVRSEGHPFFMRELTRQIHQTGLPRRESSAAPEIALDLLRQRLSRVAAPARDVLAAAGLIGRTFELSLLHEVIDLPRPVLTTALREAIRADLVVAAAEPNTLAFTHDFVRSALCDALSKGEQRRRHIAIAEALEQRLREGKRAAPSELAYHLYAALPDSDLRKTVDYCRQAANEAAAVLANADVVRYLRQALEALSLMEQPSVRLRISLLYMLCLYGRGQRSADVVRWTGELVRLARDHGTPLMVARASLMLNSYPGLKPVASARAPLEYALSQLPTESGAARVVPLVALACTSPYSYSAAQAESLLAEAEPLARKSGSRAALYLWLVGKLYLEGGPAHREEAALASEELTQLHRLNPSPRFVLAPLYVALYRTIAALQAGDKGSVIAGIELGSAHCREIRHTLLWHFDRFRAVAQVNAGAWADAMPALVSLHRRAEQQSILGTAPFCAFDRIVIFGEIGEDPPLLDDALRSALDYDACDPPSIWSMKVRALATLGLHEEAWAALRAVPPEALAALPCDNPYLGTLGHLARAALKLHATEYMEALYPLLARFPQHHAAHYAFLSEGSVPQLLGMLACALGRHDEACAQLERGVAVCEEGGFALRAAEARLSWATCLLEHGRPAQREHALTLAHEAFRAAKRVGVRSLARAVSATLRELDFATALSRSGG